MASQSWTPAFIVVFLLVSTSRYGSSSSRVLLEPDQRVEAPEGWIKLGLADDKELLRLTFAVKHSNTDKLLKIFWDVSSPESKQYGAFLTHDEVMTLVKPKDLAIAGVEDWLRSVNVDLPGACLWSRGREFLSCDLSCGQASRLLQVQWYRFTHHQSQSSVLRAARRYTVPASVAKYLDFVGGVHRFPHVARNHTKTPRASNSLGQTPSSLRKLYNVDDTVGVADDRNIQAVAQFLGQHYSKTDLAEFFLLFGESFKHQKDVAKVVGPNHFPPGTEANLDVEYIMSLGANITTWFWSVATEHESQEGFLTWLEQVANSSQVPWVFSVSYGDTEDSLSLSYMERVNQEFQKQAVRGISVMFASGDSGAGCHDSVFQPNYPASSPYVTAVGGTEGKPLSTDVIAAGLSGGGFSNRFPGQDYQKSAIDHYFQTAKDLPPARLYNRSGRAYPDVSAMAAGFLVVIDFIPLPVDGTSCATPTFSGIISLINDYLVRHGHSPLGFLNKFLYQNMAALTDVTDGCQGGCSPGGFCASAGWDPATGIGTPDYPALLKAAIASKEGQAKQRVRQAV